MADQSQQGLKGLGYELFIFLLSILSMGNLVIFLLVPGSAAQQVAIAIEFITIPVFLLDFAYRLHTAPGRLGYLVGDHGWADLVAVIPLLRVFRIFRVVKVARIARASGGRRIVRDLVIGRASATFFLTMFLVVLVVEFAGIAIFFTEKGAAGANITSASDAIWWGLVTITTVGYGDLYPVTNEGRVVGAILLFAGIALFSVLTAFIANAFLAPRKAAHRDPQPAGSIGAELDELRLLLAEQEDRSAAIRAKLDDIERAAYAAYAAPAARAAPAAPDRPAG